MKSHCHGNKLRGRGPVKPHWNARSSFPTSSAGCQRPVGLSRGKAKVCYYSGWYYCQSCHQDNSFLIPARLLHNWDTSKHKVHKQAQCTGSEIAESFKRSLVRCTCFNPGSSLVASHNSRPLSRAEKKAEIKKKIQYTELELRD